MANESQTRQNITFKLKIQGKKHLIVKSLMNSMQKQHELAISEKSLQAVQDCKGDNIKPTMKPQEESDYSQVSGPALRKGSFANIFMV